MEAAEDTRRQLCTELRRCASQVTRDNHCKGMMIEPQVGMENSPVGKSQANGRVEKAIQRLQRQISGAQQHDSGFG